MKNIYLFSALLGFILLGGEIFLLKFLSSLSGLGESLSGVLTPFLFFSVALGQLAVAVHLRFRAFAVREAVTLLAVALILLAATCPDVHAREFWERFLFLPYLSGFAVLFLLGAAHGSLYMGTSADRTRLTATFTLGLLLGNSVGFLLDHFDPRRLIFVFSAVAIGLAASLFRSVSQAAVALICLVSVFLTVEPLRAPSRYVLSNSYSSLEVSPAASPGGIPAKENDEELEAIGSEFLTRQESGAGLFLIRRNQNRALQLWDLADESQFPQLEGSRQNQIALRFMEQVRPGRIAIVGSGGGREILLARKTGFGEIFALEMNPLMIEATRTFSRNPAMTYDARNVTTLIGDARGAFERSEMLRELDMITMLAVRSYGRGIGLLFAENALLTRESIETQLRALGPGGIYLYGRGQMTQFDQPMIAAVLDVIRQLAGDRDEVAILRGADSTNGRGLPSFDLYLAFKRGGFTPDQREALLAALGAVSGYQTRIVPASAVHNAGLLSRRPLFVASDDQPFPSASGLIAFKPGFALLPVLLGVLLVVFLALSRSPAGGGPVLESALLGFGSMGLQMILSAKMVFVFGRPGLLPPLVMSGFAAAALAGYWLEMRRPSGRSDRFMAAAGLSGCFALWLLGHGFALPDRWDVVLLMLAAVSISGFFSARAFSVQLQRAGERIGWLLFLNGVGMLAGGLAVKVMAVWNGYTVTMFLLALGLALPSLRTVVRRRSSGVAEESLSGGLEPIRLNSR